MNLREIHGALYFLFLAVVLCVKRACRRHPASP